MTTPKANNVIERINEARRSVASNKFVKNQRVQGSGGGYNYIPIAQILEIVREAQAEAGVTVFFDPPVYDLAPCKDERGWAYGRGYYPVRIYGSSIDDCVEGMAPFEARSNSTDKLTNLMVTNAERNLYRIIYNIDEGGKEASDMADGERHDPEGYNEKMPGAIPDGQPIKKARAKAAEDPFFKVKPKEEKSVEEIVTNVHRDAIVKWWGKHAFDLPAWFTEIIEDFGTPDKWDDATVTSAFAKLIEAGLIPEAKE